MTIGAATDAPVRRTLGGLALWLSGRRHRYRVTGSSMEPTLHDGDHVLVDPRAYRDAPPAEGDLVLVRHPHRPGTTMLKRVLSVAADGRIDVAGDNPGESTDSRTFGALRPEHLLGRVDGLLG